MCNPSEEGSNSEWGLNSPSPKKRGDYINALMNLSRLKLKGENMIAYDTVNFIDSQVRVADSFKAIWEFSCKRSIFQ